MKSLILKMYRQGYNHREIATQVQAKNKSNAHEAERVTIDTILKANRKTTNKSKWYKTGLKSLVFFILIYFNFVVDI